ncbi:hypothetical protein OCT63_20530 [Vibrio sp. RW]|uniref:hypothetical protein n=1 Tax=Vibrio sp. RW TaxID=2998833 RepID=UPI0022CDABC8|nr:hypothetical protein [Vibrio sp. RW]MDA0146611.1 hypothetical protein [Vibrio sp. RW]
MYYEDFFLELKKLPVPDYRRSTRGYGAVLGINDVVVHNMIHAPKKGAKDIEVRIVEFFLKLPEEVQHYLIQKRLCENPVETQPNLFKFAVLDEAKTEMMEMGMSKMGFYSLLGIRNSRFDHAKERNYVMPNLAYLLETFKYFSKEEKLVLAAEYEVSAKKAKLLASKVEELEQLSK